MCSLDGVFIFTPTETHATLITQALEKGLILLLLLCLLVLLLRKWLFKKNVLIQIALESHTLVAIARACTFYFLFFLHAIIIICILSYHFLPLLSTMSHEMVPKCFRLTSIFQISFELSN